MKNLFVTKSRELSSAFQSVGISRKPLTGVTDCRRQPPGDSTLYTRQSRHTANEEQNPLHQFQRNKSATSWRLPV